MSDRSTVRELLDEKREHGFAEAERWATNFLDVCRMSDCPHAAEEHYEARLFLSGRYLAAIAELRAHRAAALTAEEIEALDTARYLVEHCIAGAQERQGKDVTLNPLMVRAAAVLTRLIGAKP